MRDRNDNMSCIESLESWLDMQNNRKCTICGLQGSFFCAKEGESYEVYENTAKNFDDLKKAGFDPQWCCSDCARMLRSYG